MATGETAAPRQFRSTGVWVVRLVVGEGRPYLADVGDRTTGSSNEFVATKAVRDDRQKREKNAKALELDTQHLFLLHRHCG